MNVKISGFVTCIEVIIYLLLDNLHDCTFKLIILPCKNGPSIKLHRSHKIMCTFTSFFKGANGLIKNKTPKRMIKLVKNKNCKRFPWFIVLQLCLIYINLHYIYLKCLTMVKKFAKCISPIN